MKRGGVTESPAGKWTRADDYVEALARRRTFRKGRASPKRSEPEAPALLLSTLPYIALLMLLGVLALGIIIAAYPGAQPQVRAPPAPTKEQGVAPRGWLQEAAREFHH
jgi:hypothetical protein